LPYGSKEDSHGEACAWFESAQKPMTGGSPHLFTMTKFFYNVKKRTVIRNEIMVFHKHPQPTAQSPHPYTKEMWKKMKL